MPLHFTIDHAARFVHVKTEGEVVLADILDYFNNLVTQNAMPYPKLFDASDVVPKFSDDDIMQLGAWVSAYGVMDPRGPIAVVAVTDESIEIVQRFMNLGGARRPLQIFDTVDKARRWLEAQPRV